MIDQNQFIADLASIHRVLRHEGVIGVGRDILTGLPCSLHSYTDRFGRSYIMQMFDKGDEDTINSKIS